MKDKGHEHLYKMTNEDIYVFTIAHLAKHIKTMGAGIKFVCDIKVIKDRLSMDSEKVDKALWITNLYEFNKLAFGLSEYWFKGINPKDDKICILGKFILNSGVFGNKDQRRKMHASETANGTQLDKFIYRIKNSWLGIFAPYEHMRVYYPVLTEHRWLMPVFWMVRIKKIILNKELRRKKIESALSIEDECMEYKDIWKAVI